MRSARLALCAVVALLAALCAALVAHIVFTTSPDNGSHAPMMRVDSFPRISQNIAMLQKPFSLSSSVFAPHGLIPLRYTCDGDETSPPLAIEGTPSETKTLALVMEDPDVPKALKPDGLFVHWVLFNMPPGVTELPPGTTIGIEGLTSAGKTGYVGPCPPSTYEPRQHRYMFTLYALDTALELEAGTTKEELLRAMEGHVIAETRLTGIYERP